jgi:hypothetical protein
MDCPSKDGLCRSFFVVRGVMGGWPGFGRVLAQVFLSWEQRGNGLLANNSKSPNRVFWCVPQPIDGRFGGPWLFISPKVSQAFAGRALPVQYELR